MQPAWGILTSRDSRSPKPIYVAVEGDEKLSFYSKPPPFALSSYIGELGTNLNLKRKRRGFIFSTFELTFEGVESDALLYITDNKFGDLLNLFI
jgi:hypothetical protein